MNIGKKLAVCGRWAGSRFLKKSAILLYHRVAGKEADHFNLCVTPSRFEEQMEAIAQRGSALSLADFMKRRRQGTLAPGSICVTFDDAYVDVMENALPILERYGIPASIFVVTGNLGKAFWWDRLAELIFRPKHLAEQIELTSRKASLQLKTAGLPRKRVFDVVYRFLHGISPDERNEQLAVLSGPAGQGREFKEPRSMTADELRSIDKHPLITLGAHTVTHSQLSKLSDEEQFAEIGSSKKELEAILDKPVESFSYPFGLKARDFTADTMKVARTVGFDHAIAADLNVVTPKSDRFALPRLWMHDWNGAGFRRNLNFWL